MLLFKGFASDLVTLQFRQFQLAALNGFVKHLIEGQAQRVYALDRMGIQHNAFAVRRHRAILTQIRKRIFCRAELTAALDDEDRLIG